MGSRELRILIVKTADCLDGYGMEKQASVLDKLLIKIADIEEYRGEGYEPDLFGPTEYKQESSSRKMAPYIDALNGASDFEEKLDVFKSFDANIRSKLMTLININMTSGMDNKTLNFLHVVNRFGVGKLGRMGREEG